MLPAEEAQRLHAQRIAQLLVELLSIGEERALGVVLQPIRLGERIELASLVVAEVEILVGQDLVGRWERTDRPAGELAYLQRVEASAREHVESHEDRVHSLGRAVPRGGHEEEPADEITAALLFDVPPRRDAAHAMAHHPGGCAIVEHVPALDRLTKQPARDADILAPVVIKGVGVALRLGERRVEIVAHAFERFEQPAVLLLPGPRRHEHDAVHDPRGFKILVRIGHLTEQVLDPVVPFEGVERKIVEIQPEKLAGTPIAELAAHHAWHNNQEVRWNPRVGEIQTLTSS